MNADDLVRENEELKAELVRLREESSQYLQNVAHQLTAPLGAIKWSIEGLTTKANVSIERRKNLLSSIYNQATILVHLIKNFTLMSNLETDNELGQFREQPQPVDMLRLAINLANDFQPQAFETKTSISVDEKSFRRTFKGGKLSVEKTLVSQAISNLLENAVKYSDAGSEIAIDAIEDEYIALRVHSFGIPIADEERDRLFDRTYRGDGARQRVPAGTGIGLYLVSHIMRLHRGSAGVEVSGRHSSFVLRFPKDCLTHE